MSGQDEKNLDCIEIVRARFIGYHASLRSPVIDMLDEVIAAMRARRIPERGLSEVPDRVDLQTLRAAVSTGGAPAIMELIQVPGRGEEAVLRGQIVLAELTRLQRIIPLFYEHLCQIKRAQDHWLRVLDLSHGLLHSAKRIGDAEPDLAAISTSTTSHTL